ncbi:MAG: hypothetical protein ACREX9_12970, partial [Gammaproteobacteria bacterium]
RRAYRRRHNRAGLRLLAPSLGVLCSEQRVFSVCRAFRPSRALMGHRGAGWARVCLRRYPRMIRVAVSPCRRVVLDSHANT